MKNGLEKFIAVIYQTEQKPNTFKTSKMSNLKDVMNFHNARLNRELTSRPIPLVVVESILVATIALATFTGNILVCTAIIRNKRLRSPTNALIFALALTDIVMSVASMPLTAGVLMFGRWIFGEGVCEFQAKFPLTLTATSLQLMVVISVNRYFCVIKPNLYRKLFTVKKAIAYASGVFFLAIVSTLLPMFHPTVIYAFHPGKCVCIFAAERNFSFSLIVGILFIVLPFVIMSCLYYRICVAVRSANRMFPQSTTSWPSTCKKWRWPKRWGRFSLASVSVGFPYWWLIRDRRGQRRTFASSPGLHLFRGVFLHVLSNKSGPLRFHEQSV